jgi:hypothetical protein
LFSIGSGYWILRVGMPENGKRRLHGGAARSVFFSQGLQKLISVAMSGVTKEESLVRSSESNEELQLLRLRWSPDVSPGDVL